MKKINNPQLLSTYLEKYNIQSVFTSDMLQYMELFEFQRGQSICKPMDEMPYFYFHVKGKLKVYAMADNGKSVLLRFNKPLSILGDVELLDERLVKCYVDSSDNSHLIGIRLEHLHKYAFDDPVFLRFIIKNLSYKLYTISNASSINLLFPLENRLASYLLSITSDEYDSRVKEIKTNNLGEMASLLGCSYRHLARVIKAFENAGIVKNEKKKLTVLDFSKLRELAGDNIYE
ncbi:helix-turn-helix domain-containing protein [Alkaliphilus serpentinus]|uniref:Cyclic nucleotide-binding domain-containing protein n=1 Tax=Alkaliphilus serpentinus TaxID=1482731 RepID=A0A833HP12_9FIRM|nr:helix-turn-helix domain-containing protein [Alkaliphilus serpentinus]KAB3529246.1 cyclic nucleotide-binding domain-containing protein [Alkaliphilus serpentinus]